MTDLAERRVLLVEDEMLVAMLLEELVIELGCKVVGPASRIDQALALAREAPVDVAVLDVNLDGQLTYPVAEALEARRIPFVFATGYGEDGLADRYKSAALLQKPFRPRDVARALAGAISASGMARRPKDQ